jgi:hypothetical protein
VLIKITTLHILTIDGGYCIEGGVDFLNFWIFNILQLNLDRQKNSKTKVEKAFFFIFMSSYAEVCFFGQKSEKVTK